MSRGHRAQRGPEQANAPSLEGPAQPEAETGGGVRWVGARGCTKHTHCGDPRHMRGAARSSAWRRQFWLPMVNLRARSSSTPQVGATGPTVRDGDATR